MTPPIVLLALGSWEQHGAHLPFDTDTVIIESVVDAAIRSVDPNNTQFSVVPTIGVTASDEHNGFAGTLSIGTNALSDAVVSIARSASWARGICIVNGHGGNAEAVAVAAVDAQAESGIPVAAATYWHMAGDAFAPILERQSNVLHACEAEASMVMALLPEAVRPARLSEQHGPHSTRVEGQPPALARRRSFKELSANGVIGDARSATAAKGEALLDAAAERIARDLANPKLWG